MFCSKCGNQCKEGTKFCDKCGALLVVKDAPMKKKTKMPVLVISISAIVLALILATFIFLFFLGGLKDVFINEDVRKTASKTEREIDKEDIEEQSDEQNEHHPIRNDSLTGEKRKTDTSSSALTTSETEAVDWRTLYLDYLNDLKNQNIINRYLSAGLIYVDNDEIPELYLEGDCEATGCLILTCSSCSVDVLHTDRIYFTYMEKHNLLNNSEGNMGGYYDIIYSIEDGKWICVANGTCSEMYGVNGPVMDENGDIIYQYTWMDQSVSSEEYERELAAVYNQKMAKVPDECYTLDEMETILRSGETSSKNHRYELIVADVTWTEAEAICRQKGGYLATLTSQEEFDQVTNQIVGEGKTKISFYVGATRDDSYDGIGEYHWLHDHSGDSMFYGALYSFWLSGEPSYSSVTQDGETMEEKYVDLIYRQNEGRCYLNDVADDILAEAPSYKGAIGYICEYDN